MREAELKKSLAEWIEEVIRQDPEWVRERRTDYLIGRIIELFKEIDWWRHKAEWAMRREDGWWGEVIDEKCIRPEERKILKMVEEINAYYKPSVINYEIKITNDDIQRAKERPLDEVSGLEFRRSGTNRMKACCPFHDEKTSSFVWYVNQNTFHCYGCGENGDAITYVMKTRNMSFIEVIRFLARI